MHGQYMIITWAMHQQLIIARSMHGQYWSMLGQCMVNAEGKNKVQVNTWSMHELHGQYTNNTWSMQFF